MKVRKMKIDSKLDEDGCLDIEIIENSVTWQKELGGKNLLIQDIKGGEGFRIIEEYAQEQDITDFQQHGKALIIAFSDGNKTAYYQDKKGNYRQIQELKRLYSQDNYIENIMSMEEENEMISNRQKKSEKITGKNNASVVDKRVLQSIIGNSYTK